ncbi:MAG: tRNA pseudouridine(38-40) synthase TruA, partial [Candidatus Thorarchaeota archaeon]
MSTYIARLFYLGTAYHGSQWQPNVRTIQGEIVDALVSWSHENHNHETVILSGRTDRGVSSLGQIVRFTTEKKPNLERINSHLPDDISLWAISEVKSDYNPRYNVLSRYYKYYLNTSGLNLDLSRIRQAQKHFRGLNNYALLSKPDSDRSTHATILNIASRNTGSLLVFDFHGVSFLWKLVRKSVTLLKWIGLGLYSPETVRDLLDGRNVIPGGIEPAPPEGLIFIEATIPIRMKPDMKALKRIRKTIASRTGLHKRTAS